MTVKRLFEFVEGTSSKFWEIWREGTQVMTRYGRIGADGQTTVKDEKDEAKAAKLFERLIKEKTGKGYVEKSGKTPVKKEKKGPASTRGERPARAERAAKWTATTRKLLHGFSTPHPHDPADAVMSVDAAWANLCARYQHLLTVTLAKGAIPKGNGEMAGVVEAVVRSFAKDQPPPKLRLVEEFCRAAMMQMTEGGWSAQANSKWESWSYARALVALWLDRGGIEFVFDVLNHPPVFRLRSDRSSAEGNGSFSEFAFSKTPKELESGQFTAHPRSLDFDIPGFPVVVGRFHDGREGTTAAPASEAEWYRANKRLVTTDDGGTLALNDQQFFYVVHPAAYLWALRARLAALPEPEFQAHLEKWQKKAPLREDPLDVGTAFAFSRNPTLVAAAVQRLQKAPDDGGALVNLLFAVASPEDAKVLAGLHAADSNYALDLIDHLDAKAGPVLKAIAAKANSYSAKQWKAALKLLP